MTSTPFDEDELLDALDSVGADCEIRADYSGRAMFGDECFGIVHNGADVLIGVAFACLIGDDYLVAAELAQAARTDSMGRSTITYFPGWTLAKVTA